jgi:UDPglucose--hexose-1-phosphate uridylyltransferase
VQIFENRGPMMGASNPHPHSQIWANETIPKVIAAELACCAEYQRSHDSCLLCDYVKKELEYSDRLVVQNEHFVALAPFWAVWPFETMVLSKRHVGSLPELSQDERLALADIMKRLTTRYDNRFQNAFPYSMGFHQIPVDGRPYPELHLHAHYYPPLLRSANIRKFLVGYELLANPQRDITAETAASDLRNLSDDHYSSPAAEPSKKGGVG